MKGEIDKDFYCSADCYENGICRALECARFKCEHKTIYGADCGCYHRKHPTPEQFEEEYGEEVPDDMAVYYLDNKPIPDWVVSAFWENVRDEYEDGQCVVVVACTPFVPNKDWRP